MEYLLWIISIAFISLIAFIISPLIMMLQLKIKHGNKVIISWFPFQGVIPPLLQAYKKYGDLLYYYKHYGQTHPEAELKIMNSIRGTIIYEFFGLEQIKFIQTNPKFYQKIPNVTFGERYLYKGLLFQENEDWKLSRRILSKSFEFQQLKNRIPLIKQQCEAQLKFSNNQNINIIKVASKIAGEVVTSTFFSQKYNDSGDNLTQDAYQVMFGLLTCGNRKLGVTIRRMFFKSTRNMPDYFIFSYEKKELDKLDQIKQRLTKIIQARLDDPNPQNNDFLQAYVEEMRINKSLTIDHAIQQYLILLFAGIDTTSNFFGHCCYALSVYPQYQDQLRIQIKEQINNYDQLTSENINKFPLLNAFIDECLRMYSPVPLIIDRIATQDHFIGQYFIKKNTVISQKLMTMNYNQKYYDDPFTFKPERWLNKISQDPFIFIPFSSGQRNCIGQHLAQIELKSMLIYMLLNYKIQKAVDTVHWTFKFVYTIVEEQFIKVEKLN